MEHPKRARSGKPRTQPRDATCVESIALHSALERIRQVARTRACAVRPEAGAQCGKSARWDLRGGCPERGIPTATE